MDYCQHLMHDGIEPDMYLGLRDHNLPDSWSVMMNPRCFVAISPNSVLDCHFCMCSIHFTFHTYKGYPMWFPYRLCLVHRSLADNSRSLSKGTKEIWYIHRKFYVGMHRFLHSNTLTLCSTAENALYSILYWSQPTRYIQVGL